jgi:hypothetical protein
MGILSSHVPSVEELKPGLLEVIESSGTKKWFGGYLQVEIGCDEMLRRGLFERRYGTEKDRMAS